jgi:1-acyl-sn-glycerol-3-phosphate acyltransferase
MAKQELFRNRWHAWFLNALGGFPVDRRGADLEAIDVARRILHRGDCVVIFPEGKCMPPGQLGQPRRGVGRLAQATGATVVPVAITGTEPTSTRRVPLRRIRVQVAAPLSFPMTDLPNTPDAASVATERIWAAVTGAWTTLTGTSARREPTHASPSATSDATTGG